MQTITTIADLRAHLLPLRQKKIALVPTMGALHAGHLALVRAAHAAADHVVVSVFVNPAQFAPHEDFDAYPRDVEKDVALIESIIPPHPNPPPQGGREPLGSHEQNGSPPLAGGVRGGGKTISIFVPSVAEIYPAATATQFELGEVDTRWESIARPHFFKGVALVVSKLFNIVQPDVALFGEKDFQQLAVVRQLVANLSMPIEIMGIPIVREESGLAMSSRNAYLTHEQRTVTAPRIYATMQSAAHDIRAGGDVEKILAAAKEKLTAAGFSKIDYFAYVDSNRLMPISCLTPHTSRLLVAATLGQARLIDNLAVT